MQNINEKYLDFLSFSLNPLFIKYLLFINYQKIYRVSLKF